MSPKPLPDDSEMDATDGAHPAWWRGYHACETAFETVMQRAQEPPTGGTYGSPVAQKIDAMARELADLRAKLAAAREDHQAAEDHLAAIVRTWERADEDARGGISVLVPGLREEVEEVRDGREGDWWRE